MSNAGNTGVRNTTGRDTVPLESFTGGVNCKARGLARNSRYALDCIPYQYPLCERFDALEDMLWPKKPVLGRRMSKNLAMIAIEFPAIKRRCATVWSWSGEQGDIHPPGDGQCVDDNVGP